MRNFCGLPVLFLLCFVSCTNVSFQQFYDGPKGINFSYGPCIVNEIQGPISKDAKIRLTSIAMEYLNKMSDSVVHIDFLNLSAVRSIESPPNINSVSEVSNFGDNDMTSFKEAKEYLHKNGDSILRLNFLGPSGFNPQSMPSVINSELIDPLREQTCFYYLVSIRGTSGKNIKSGFVISSDLHNGLNNEQYFDNRATIEISIFDIQSNTEIYYQKIIADEMTSTEYDSDRQSSSSFVFTRSSENVMKNALVRGLRSLKRHSLKITKK